MRPDALCVACGARHDEHGANGGPCARTKCKGFSDPYYAFNEGGGGPGYRTTSPEHPIVPPDTSGQHKADWSVLGITTWTGIALALAVLLLYVIGAVLKLFR